MRLARQSNTRPIHRENSDLIIEIVKNLNEGSLILNSQDSPIYLSKDVQTYGLIQNQKLVNQELSALVRVVRRTGVRQYGKIVQAISAISGQTREITVNIFSVGGSESEGDLIVILMSDESELQRVHEVRRDFVANISHELKTPIGALSLLSEAVLEANGDQESVSKFASRMQIEAKRLTDLVQEIIQLSRVQDSDPLNNPQIISASSIIKEALDQARTTAGARGISLSYDQGADGTFLGDKEQLTMAVHNLIENAINYSPKNTRVSITTSLHEGALNVTVADQGIGIPEREHERIFERFYRVDPARSRETGGTGLGLSIVKHIVQKHGGEISVWSVEGIGSTFTIRLPLTDKTDIKDLNS
jgi:two-component system sensor histidine kinase SenX3